MNTGKCPLRLAILGDSIADGQGASRRRDRLADRLADGLNVHGIPTELGVFAVRRARSTDLPPQVDHALAWGLDLAVIVIGANDLAQLAPGPRALHAYRESLHRLRAGGI